MDEDNELRVGEVYETTIKISNRGYVKRSNGDIVTKAIYLGRNAKRTIEYHHVIVFRGNINVPELWRFKNYYFRDGKLEIIGIGKDRPSRSEREYLEKRLKNRIIKCLK